jgi:hypothetical protein
MRNLSVAAGLLASLTTAHGALAQNNSPASASSSGQANVGVSLPGATATTAAAGTSDHDQMVGRLAVGYFGIANTGAGANTGATGPNDTPYAVTGVAPVVGVRYWLNQLIGLDVGVGMSIIGGSIKAANGTSTSRGSFTGFTLHGGVPLALASADHFAFEIIPELNVGFAGGGIDPNGATAGDVSYSGFHFDLGARAGAEISFGFIHLPQLSLVGSVGLRFDTDTGKTTDSTVTPEAKTSSSRSEFHTTVGANPWAIFTNQVAALYYF